MVKCSKIRCWQTTMSRQDVKLDVGLRLIFEVLAKNRKNNVLTAITRSEMNLELFCAKNLQRQMSL